MVIISLPSPKLCRRHCGVWCRECQGHPFQTKFVSRSVWLVEQSNGRRIPSGPKRTGACPHNQNTMEGRRQRATESRYKDPEANISGKKIYEQSICLSRH